MNETYETILARMLARVPEGIDKREGSLIWDACAPAAVELQLMYIGMADILQEAFGDTASREFLIRRSAERGLTPFAATRALLRGVVAPAGMDIAGRRFVVPNTGVGFVAEAPLAGDPGAWAMRCERPGVEGNQFMGPILPAPGSVPVEGLQSAALTAVLVPGRDEEDTESIRRRYFDSFEGQAFGGNVRDYRAHTRSLEGVGAVKVTPVPFGGGTVGLTVLDADLEPASPALIAAVRSAIDPTGDGHGQGIAPIGHTVTVRTAELLTVDVTTRPVLAHGYDAAAILPRVRAVLAAYFTETRRDWENRDTQTLLISQINSRILTVPGVADIHGTLLNGRDANLEIPRYAVAVLGEVQV